MNLEYTDLLTFYLIFNRYLQILNIFIANQGREMFSDLISLPLNDILF